MRFTLSTLLPGGRCVSVVWRRVLAATVALAVLLAPLAVPPERRLGRFLAGVVALAVLAKGFDEAIGARGRARAGPFDWRGFLAFLLNPFGFVRRESGRTPAPSRHES